MSGKSLADSLDEAVELIARAPFATDGWNSALLAATNVAGGWGAQMFAQSPSELRFNAMVNVPDEAIRDYVAVGGADPKQSPRINAGINGPMMKTITDSDYMVPEYRRKYAIYNDFYDKYDAGYACSGRLENRDGLTVVVASLRGAKNGDFERAGRDAFESLFPHFRNAFALQMAIESEATMLSVNSLSAVGIAAMVCDANGKLIVSSPTGDALLNRGEYLTARNGRLVPSSANCESTFASALRLAGSPVRLSAPTMTSVMLRDREGLSARLVQISPFPGDTSVGFSRGVLVAIPVPSGFADSAVLTCLGLTGAEAEVASATAKGLSPAHIAAHRGVTRETVRSQIKAVYAKLDVHNAAQLATKLNEL